MRTAHLHIHCRSPEGCFEGVGAMDLARSELSDELLHMEVHYWAGCF